MNFTCIMLRTTKFNYPHTKEMKAETWTGICTPMFAAPLFTEARS